MSRSCMRSRCDRPAQVRLTYDTLRCRVFLDDLPDTPGMYQEICEYHAVRLKLPMGWELSDRRGATPALFDLEALVRVPSSVRGGIVTRPGGPGSERIDLSDPTRIRSAAHPRSTPPPPEPPRTRPPSTPPPPAPPGVAVTGVGSGAVFSTSPTRATPVDRGRADRDRVPGAVAGTRTRRPSGGLRDGRSRASRGRRPLPTPTELFGGGSSATSGGVEDEGEVTVVSVGDRSIETVIVLGPDVDAPVAPDERGRRERHEWHG